MPEDVAAARQQAAQEQKEQAPEAAVSTSSQTGGPAAPAAAAAGEKKYCCPTCGKCFESLAALRGHCGATGHPFPKEYLGEKVSTTRKKEVESEEEVGVPDPYEHLKQMLIVFGVRERDANAIITYMKPYSVDNLDKLYEAVREYLPKSKLKLFIESWANVRGIPIPLKLRRELGITTQPTDPRLQMLEEEMRAMGYVPSPKHSDGIVELVKILVDKLLPSPAPNNGGNDELVQQLLRENQELKERLEKLERENELKSLIDPIRQELQEVKRKLETVREKTDFQTELVRGFYDVVKEGLGIYKNVVETLTQVRATPPKREVVGNPQTLVNLVEEMGGEVG